MKYGFGVDIGPSLVKMACYDTEGNLIHKWTIPTQVAQGSNQVLSDIADEVDHYMQENSLMEDDIVGIGVGVHGPVSDSGTVNKCVNLGWGVFNINRALSGITGLNVKASNISNAAAMGECWKGAAKGKKNVFFLHMNYGIGGAVISNGELIYGSHGGGGEVGHVTVNRQETEPCNCGNKGCMEQYCSPFGIVRTAKKQLASPLVRSSMRRKANLQFEDVIEAANEGDKVAHEVLDKCCTYTGEVLANVCCITNPDTIVLGGELARKGQFLIEGLSRYFHKYAFHANKDVRFEIAKLGEDAATLGAFKLALDAFEY